MLSGVAVVTIVVGCLLYWSSTMCTNYSIGKDAGESMSARQFLGFSCELTLRVHSQSG